MASGNKSMVINTRERALSNDHNRSESFNAALVAESFRWLYAFVAVDEGGSGTMPVAASPTAGWMVLNGLFARPEIGTINLFIEPGTAGMVSPDVSPSADDSPFKVITSPGVQNAGDLTLTAGGGGTRIDVIEFRRNANTVDETANRDIYNPNTGQFVPTLVTKVRSDKLEFRIRLGTPGGGFPGTAAGWYPVAVCSVPNAATTWNDVIVWDVRPLVADLSRNTPRIQNFPLLGKSYGTLLDDGSAVTLSGVFESQLSQWRAGGEVAASNSGLSGGLLELDSSEITEPGLAPVNGLPIYVYAAMPFSLPRWARYTAASSGVRRPLPLNGIPIYSDQASDFRGRPTAALSLPTALGLGGTTSEAVVLASSAWKAGALVGASIADSWTRLADFPVALSPASTVGDTCVFEIQDGTHHPRGATAVRMRFTIEHTGTPLGDPFELIISVRCLNASTDAVSVEQFRITKVIPNTGVCTTVFETTVPLHALSNMPTGSAVTRRIEVEWQVNGVVSVTPSDQAAHVVGWRLGM